jgi:chromosome segregation ATPase
MNPMITGSGFVTQPPLDDLPQASQSTLLLQKLKEMAEVQQQLDRKKEEFRSRMQRCQEKEVALASRQEDIKEQVQKFDKFLKDNDAKRVRADRKVQEERKAAEQKEREKQELIQFLQREDQKRLALKAEVESFIGLGDLKQVDDRWGKTNLTFYLDPDPI